MKLAAATSHWSLGDAGFPVQSGRAKAGAYLTWSKQPWGRKYSQGTKQTVEKLKNETSALVPSVDLKMGISHLGLHPAPSWGMRLTFILEAGRQESYIMWWLWHSQSSTPQLDSWSVSFASLRGLPHAMKCFNVPLTCCINNFRIHSVVLTCGPLKELSKNYSTNISLRWNNDIYRSL